MYIKIVTSRLFLFLFVATFKLTFIFFLTELFIEKIKRI